MWLNRELVFKNKIRELEDRSRRNNLRIDGIRESVNESVSKNVSEMFENKLGSEKIVIERAHREICQDTRKK